MKLTVKPRTQLIFDVSLFFVLLVTIIATFIQHVITPEGTHGYEMMHLLHGITGILMTLLVLIHLVLHARWIIAQVKMALKSNHPSSRASAKPRPSHQ
ncbi:MAG: hypothetical protein F9K46_09840 [Anaerolineae bacterium]|nr:MAG: hypothetical protein F9K46_09840 [Anaerolineae bacterium]